MNNDVQPATAPAPVWKACNGPALAPLKFSHLQRVNTDGSIASAASATPTGPPKYVPPSQRKAEEASTPGKPKSLSTNDVDSEAAFPSLAAAAATPKGGASAGQATPGSWTHIRAKLLPSSAVKTPLPNTPFAPLSPIAPDANQFAAFDDDRASVSTPSSRTTTATTLNYMGMMKERIKKDRQDEALREVIETDDPLEMEDADLLNNGWAILKLKAPTAAEPPKLQFDEAEDREAAYFEGPGTMENIDVLANAMRNYEDSSHKLLTEVCGPAVAGEDPWAAAAAAAAAAAITGDDLVVSELMAAAAARRSDLASRESSFLRQMMERKKAARALATTATPIEGF